MARRKIKRENGTGSVYKRSDIKRRPWVAVTPARYDVDGDKLVAEREIIGYYVTAQEAKDALEDYRRHPTTKLNMTWEELYDEWSELAYRDLSRQMVSCYKAAWSKMEHLGGILVREIRTGQLQAVIDKHSTMSHSSLNNIKILAGQMMEYAEQNDIIHKNYAQFVRLPKKEKVVKDCFTDLELKKIEQAVGVIPWADVILMMCYTGFRVTEFLTLTPHCYDRQAGTLTGGLKTDAGRDRVVPVHHKIKPLLESWIARGGDTIICKDDGSQMTANYFRNYKYYPALEAIGVRKLSPHATRHTFATRLATAGARPEDIQALAGHEDYSMTANVYIHKNVEALREAVERMG